MFHFITTHLFEIGLGSITSAFMILLVMIILSAGE